MPDPDSGACAKEGCRDPQLTATPPCTFAIAFAAATTHSVACMNDCLPIAQENRP